MAAIYASRAKPQPVFNGPTHFHVAAIGIRLAIPPVITNNQADAIIEYQKMKDLVSDTTGSFVVYWEKQRVTFDDGSSVRWFECDKGCNEPIP